MTESTGQPTVLVLDDEKNIRKSIEMALSQENIQVVSAHDPAAAMRVLNERIVDALIVDIQLGEIDGLTFFKKIQSDGFRIPTIFISGHATLTQAAQTVKMCAYDFIEKPFSSEKLLTTVQRCLEFSATSERLRLIEIENGPIEILGDSLSIRQVVSDALKVAKTNSSVLITGESGTGKELVANTIHAHSQRYQGPFVKVNCSAIPENLVETELFGHERGAFTGALNSKRGLFEIANRGTIFLDEVADLSLSAQAKMLRVLQNGEIQKVGSEKTVKVDVRILSGSHKDLKAAVAAGLFREDLFYRLNVIPINVPSLRERVNDIPLLVKYFSKQLCEKNNIKEKEFDDVLLELKRYPWPGNVRELKNVLERIIIMSGSRITINDLPEEFLATDDNQVESVEVSTLKSFRDKAEREFIINVLKKNSGNISQSAVELEVGRTYLHKRLAMLNISKKDYYL